MKNNFITFSLFAVAASTALGFSAYAKHRCLLSHLPAQRASEIEWKQEYKRLVPIFSERTNIPVAQVKYETRVYDFGGVGSGDIENQYRKAGIPTFGGITPFIVAETDCQSPTLECLAKSIVIARKISLVCSSLSY